MYKGIVFDLDGTLVDSPLCFNSIRRQLDIPENEYILEFLERLPHLEKTAKLAKLVEIELEAAKKAVLFPDVLSLLTELQASEIRIGIFTRNCRVATQHIIESFGMKIDLIITRDDAPPKPDPAGIRKFLTQWNLLESELLFVGDYRFDIECGKKAGVRTALFINGQPQLEEWNPDYVIPQFSHFWSHISKGV